jgi:hypothetical protein
MKKNEENNEVSLGSSGDSDFQTDQRHLNKISAEGGLSLCWPQRIIMTA